MKHWCFLLIILAFGCGPEKQSLDTDSGIDSLHIAAGALYANYCAGCHGSDMLGGSATGLLKHDWIYGRTRSLMFRNVKFGIEGTDMAGFENLLSEDQISMLVDYVRESQQVPPDKEVIIPESITTKDYQISIEQVVPKGLETPWAIEFTDRDNALISEKKGQLRWLVGGVLDSIPIKGTPVPYTGTSTAGFMDIALDPDYQRNGWVYLGYSHSEGDLKDKNTPATTRIIRGKIENHQWVDQENLFLAQDSLFVTNGNRWGCRLMFGDMNHLYFTIGDMARDMDSQDPKKVSGKIYRINRDGSIPSDNPFLNTPGAIGAVFSLGNRNVQGFSVHPETKEIWFSEHGPMGGDELNILERGNNYGWPVITYGKDYSGAIVSTKTHQPGMQQPITYWTPSIGICPIEFVESDQFPAWHSNLLVGALAFEELFRCVIEDGQIVDKEMILKGFGRVRDVKTAPDGSIYVVLNRPDIILRLSVKQNSA